MIAIKGSPIPLTVQLTRSGTLYPGQSLTVRVLRQNTGSEDLPTTAMSEVSPGVYNYNWLTPPAAEVNMLAQYVINSKVTTCEEVQVISLDGAETRSSINEIVGIVQDTDMLEGIVEDTLELEGIIEDTLDLEGIVEDTQELEGVIEETEELAGIVEDSK